MREDKNLATRLQEYFDGLTGYLLITDSHAHILYASKGLEKSKGFLVKDIVGKTPGKVWGGKMSERFYKNMWETIAGKKMPFVGTLENTKKDLTPVKEAVHIIPILDEKGEAQYFIEVQPDFEDEKQAALFKKQFLSEAQHNPPHVLHRLWSWLRSEEFSTPDADEVTQLLMDKDPSHKALEKIFISQRDRDQAQDEKNIEAAQINKELYGELYTKYKGKIYNYLFYRLSNRELAEELTAETFAKAFEHFEYYKITHASYFSYLLAAAHNILVNYYRKAKSVSLDTIENMSREENFPLMQKIEFALLWEKVRTLSPLEQKILVMKYQDDLSVATIAERLGKTENAVKLMLSRARQKLKQKK